MTDPEKVKLLFGPYKAPPLRRGDRATCLYRRCDLVITGWSDARIPWPWGLAKSEQRGGRYGLLVDEELARAVRHESAVAVCFWWGVGKMTVSKWRKALDAGKARRRGRDVKVFVASWGAEKDAYIDANDMSNLHFNLHFNLQLNFVHHFTSKLVYPNCEMRCKISPLQRRPHLRRKRM